MRHIYFSEICSFLEKQDIEFTFHGNSQGYIEQVCALSQPKHTAITWLKYASLPTNTEWNHYLDNLFIIPENAVDELAEVRNFNTIACRYPKAVFSKIITEFFVKSENKEGIAKTSVVETSNVGQGVSIGHHCYIGPRVIIEDYVTIAHNVTIEGKVRIGKHTAIYSGVRIGTDGFGYYEENGVYQKAPHIGGVNIGEYVEIGANTCIDRAMLEDTIIGDYTKIDNLCHIGHNVQVGKASTIIAQSCLGGSSILEERAYIAPGAVVLNQLKIGANSLVGAGAVVTCDVEKNKVVAGVPAKVLRDNN